MILNKEHWTKSDYQEFLTYLNSKQDKKYSDFHQNLVKDDTIIGIRTPILKEIAKEISKGNCIEFINLLEHNTYEEKTIHGLILGYIKCDFNILLNLIDEFIKYNDNWATNDLTVANMKIFKKNLEAGLDFINKYLNSNDCWKIRFALILLLDYYVNDQYIDYVLTVADSITNEEYYVKMGNAWLISLCYIKYPEKTKNFLETTKIDKWTYNKAISKICDSFRVSIEDKEYLKKTRK